MKISFERKILLGFIINLCVVLTIAWIYILPVGDHKTNPLNWLGIALIVLSAVLLGVVYYIIRVQIKARNISKHELSENKKLLQSIIDNTSIPIYVKRINGEYLLINRECEKLYGKTNEEVVGKTDHDILPKEAADSFRETDLEVVKEMKELTMEETLPQPDGIHTYLSVKFPLFDSDGRVYAVGGISTDITDRKVLEKSLHSANKFFHMALDMMVIASEYKFLKINPVVLDVLGYSKKELLKKPYINFVHPEDRDLTQKQMNKLQEGEKLIKFENRWICKDGTIKTLIWSASPDLSSDTIYAVARDITKQKEIVQSLIMTDKFFTMSYDVFAVTRGNFCIKINPAYTKTLGYTEKDMETKPFTEIIHPDDLEVVSTALDSITSEKHVVNYQNRVICKDGSIKWLDWHSGISEEEGILYSVARDITEQVELEIERQISTNKLFENEEKLRLILENISEGVVVVNAEKKIVLTNDTANEIFEVADDVVMSDGLTDHLDLYFPDEKTIFPYQNLPLERAFDGEPTDDVDVVLWNPVAKVKKRVLMSGRPLIDEEQGVFAVVVTIKDISRYKEMESELEETEEKYRKLIGFRKREKEEKNNNNDNGDDSSKQTKNSWGF